MLLWILIYMTNVNILFHNQIFIQNIIFSKIVDFTLKLNIKKIKETVFKNIFLFKKQFKSSITFYRLILLWFTWLLIYSWILFSRVVYWTSWKEWLVVFQMIWNLNCAQLLQMLQFQLVFAEYWMLLSLKESEKRE